MTHKDAIFGLVDLFLLYAIRIGCDRLSRHYPRRGLFSQLLLDLHLILTAQPAFFSSSQCSKVHLSSWTLPLLLGYMLATIRAKRVHIQSLFLGLFPRVLKPLVLPQSTITSLAHSHQSFLWPPSSCFLSTSPSPNVSQRLHCRYLINICAAFGRINGYKIYPNQELIVIGVTNTIRTCFGAFPAMGSFSWSALNSKAGMRTPLAGILTGIIIVVALYSLTPAFYWIPTTALSAVIIHAVADLVTKPNPYSSFTVFQLFSIRRPQLPPVLLLPSKTIQSVLLTSLL
jgi:solute carrier family 26 (sodium-independent sulfate anion transporter), member 11